MNYKFYDFMSINFDVDGLPSQVCKTERTTMCGALTAAGLKATSVLKELGNRWEHYSVITLVDCRSLVGSSLSDHSVGKVLPIPYLHIALFYFELPLLLQSFV